MKYFLYSLIITLTLIAPLHNAGAVSLKQHSVVQSNDLMLSDVFDALPNGKDRVLGASPQPGQEMTLNARTLMRIALALDLDWRPAHSNQALSITRAATIIDETHIKNTVNQAIADERSNNTTANNDHYEIIFTSALRPIILSPEHAATTAIKSLIMSDNNTRFEAIVVAPSLQNPQQETKLYGNLYPMIDVPVLNTTLRKGMIVGKRDITTQRIRQNTVKHDTILSANEIIGMTPRRVILPNQTIQLNDIEAPVVVERGEYVTMIFQDGAMRLTTKGKALENGAKGDIVRVANLSTSRTVEALVNAQNEVIIRKF